ncbi:MAG: metal ABC transporter substrate-binding protein [Acholeplasma sp.]|nr:metal ABC transporter substrate-binding protein [Acholeplasma sp.]
MKRIFYIIILVFLTTTLASCQENTKVDIVATMFPQYDIAKNIVGDKMTVSLLTAPGVEAHDYQPTSKQMITIKSSKLFLFTSYEMDTWLNDNLTAIIGDSVPFLNMSKNFDLNLLDDKNDLHYWTSTNVFIDLIDSVLHKLISIDPTNSDYYQEKANAYINKISNLRDEMVEYFISKEKPTLFFAGHNALGAFANDFNLTIKALSNTSKPDAVLNTNQIIDLLNEIKKAQTHFLFTEELKEPKIAKTIQTELANSNYSLMILELHGYHNLTKIDFDNEVTYYDILARNFANIKTSLGDN